MSWDQGITLREELSIKLINFLEKRYEELVGEKRQLEYITWFGIDKVMYADFGIDHPHLKIRVKDPENIT